MPELSIIIVNWNTANLLQECLLSILEHSPEIDYEIIVVDNASTDGSAAKVQSEFGHLDNLKLVCNQRNENYARGNNIGLVYATGNYVCLLNSDVIVQARMFSELRKSLAANCKVGLVGPKILLPNKTIQRLNRRFPTWYYIFFTYSLYGKIIDRILFRRFFWRQYFYIDEGYRQITAIEQIGTSCAMLRRATIDKLGYLFDEQFELYFNDVDLCKRLNTLGYLVIVNPAAEIIHTGGQSTQLLSKAQYNHFLWDGIRRYFKKYRLPGRILLYFLFPRLIRHH
jgi:GT2 family glycosyltransferase